tara:strand:+ start:134 stop:613 length:480 start_codon:yes stop_codon:yes gene_type:complete
MSKIGVRNSIEYNEKKYPMMSELYENIIFDKSTISKLINMKKTMRKYINELDLKREEHADKALKGDIPRPTNVTHIWYEEAKKYKKSVNRLKAELKELQDKDLYHKYFLREREEKQMLQKENVDIVNENKRLRAENDKLKGIKPVVKSKSINVLDLNYE